MVISLMSIRLLISLFHTGNYAVLPYYEKEVQSGVGEKRKKENGLDYGDFVDVYKAFDFIESRWVLHSFWKPVPVE